MKNFTLPISILILLLPFQSHAQQDTMAVKTIKGITDKMIELISGGIDEPRDWEEYQSLFLPTAQKSSLRPNAPKGKQIRTQNIEEFIEKVGPLYGRDGFKELSIGLTVHEYNGIAMAFQSYHSKNLLGTYEAKGINCYQLVYMDNRWWIANTLFVGEDAKNKIPDEYIDAQLLAKAIEKKPAQPGEWQRLETAPYRGKQDDISFVDKNTGWYVNGYGKIFHTKDGGATWEMQLEQKGTFFRTIAFIDKNVGFAGTVGTDYFPNVTDTIPLYGTVDGGQTWAPVTYDGPYVKGLCAIDIVKEEYINHGKLDYKYHIYAVGRVGSPANMMVSHDSGKTWKSHSMTNDCQMLLDIKMIDKNTGFACAATNADASQSNALILKTTDAGKTWRKVYQSTRPYEITWKASFPTDKVGYVTIQSYNPDQTINQQRVAKTTDGGETWTEVNLVKNARARQFGIGFVDENHGFVGTMTSGFETKDGGQTWKAIDLGAACNKIKIYRDDPEDIFGYAIGVKVYKMEL